MLQILIFLRKKKTYYEQLDFMYTSLVLKNNIIKEQYYLGTILIYKNTLPYLKNAVEWHKLFKNQRFMGFCPCTGKKKDFCEKFEKESLNLAYTRTKKNIYFYHLLFHGYKKNRSCSFHHDIKSVKAKKRTFFSQTKLTVS